MGCERLMRASRRCSGDEQARRMKRVRRQKGRGTERKRCTEKETSQLKEKRLADTQASSRSQNM
eukprot:59175-Pleurochrysis_carterae.AAC.1